MHNKRIGLYPNVFPRGTHQIFDAPSIRLLTEIRRVSSEKARIPEGTPVSENVANAVTRVTKALLMMEAETLVMKAYSPMHRRIASFRRKGKFNGSAGSADGSL